MTKLSVNLNKVALLRNQRTLGIPSVTRAAVIALDAGAVPLVYADGNFVHGEALRKAAQEHANR